MEPPKPGAEDFGEPRNPRPSKARISVSFMLGLALLAFVIVSAAEHHKPGPRLSRTSRLVDLIQAEDQRDSQLRGELDDLRKQLSALEAGDAGGRSDLAAIRKLFESLAPYAGLAAIKGPGLRVTLQDSPLRRSPTGDPNDLVIHQQDMQAVVNALWAGGAEGIGVNGERITALSAIRCVGNTLLLHGNLYSPPYVISAIGNERAMKASLSADPGSERLRLVSETFKVGYAVTVQSSISLPAYRGDLASSS
ncbi:MAG: DUF881 domain-containing protein [Actinomycetota bacterium]